MRVVILTDAGFSRREHSLLSRLEIGLADEGVRVIHALPASGADPSPSAAADLFPARSEAGAADHAAQASAPGSMAGAGGLYCTSVAYEDVGFTFSLPARARRLARTISEALDEPGEVAVDLIHVFGHHAWGMGAELAGITGARIVLEAWSSLLLGLVARAPASSGRVREGAAGITEGPPARAMGAPVFMVPGRALAEALSRQAPLASVHVAPWGVPVGEARPDAAEARDGAVAATVLATGEDAQAVLMALEGLRDAAGALPQLLVFLDSRAAGRAQIWRRVRRLGLMERLSVVADIESRREPILHTNVLVQPEAMGEHRSLILAAMGAGMSVVARADPMVDSLIDGRTARLVTRASPGGWAEALTQVLTERAYADRLAVSARQYVHDRHSVSAYVSAVLTAYETILAPPARVTA